MNNEQGLTATMLNGTFMTVSNRYVELMGIDFILEELKLQFSRKYYDAYGLVISHDGLEAHITKADEKTKRENIRLYKRLLDIGSIEIAITKKGETPYKIISND